MVVLAMLSLWLALPANSGPLVAFGGVGTVGSVATKSGADSTVTDGNTHLALGWGFDGFALGVKFTQNQDWIVDDWAGWIALPFGDSEYFRLEGAVANDTNAFILKPNVGYTVKRFGDGGPRIVAEGGATIGENAVSGNLGGALLFEW